MRYKQDKYDLRMLWNILFLHSSRDWEDRFIIRDYINYYDERRNESLYQKDRIDSNPEFFNFITYYVNRRIELSGEVVLYGARR